MNRATMIACLLAAVLPTAPARGGGQTAVLTGIVLDTDRTVDCTSHQAIVRDVWREGMNEQQKAYALWRFFIQRNMHKEAAPEIDPGNAAELLTRTGYALCGTWARHYASLAADAGLTAASVGLQGHVVAAVKYWGDWHTYDVDMWALYPKSDGVIASPGEIRRLKDKDGRYVLRQGPPVKSFPWYEGPDSIEGTAALYANANVGQPLQPQEKRKWVYDLSLRPGAEISWSWYPDPDAGFVCITHLPDVRSKQPTNNLREYLEGAFDYYLQAEGKKKWNWGGQRGGLVPNPLGAWNGVDGNGRLTYDLSRDAFRFALAMAEESKNLKVEGGRLALADPAQPGQFILNFDIPYPYGDAWVEKPLPEGALKVDLSYDGKTYRPVYPQGGADDGQRIRLFDFVRGRSGFRLRVTLAAGAAPLERFCAVGAFHHNYTVLPGLAKGANQVSVRLDNPQALGDCPLHATYVFDQVAEGGNILRHQRTVTFAPGRLTAAMDTGPKHWPLMREIRLRAGGPPPADAQPVEETGERDWGALPWDWAYWTVNFSNDFERGDRQGWAGRLTTKKTFAGSDLALEDSLMTADGQRQLKIIRFGAFLNRDSRFRCRLFVNGIRALRLYTRNQGDTVYYGKEFTDLQQGQWQAFEVAMNDLADPKDAAKKIQNGQFLANIYMQVWPAEGKQNKDVEFFLDDAICHDGPLKFDPFADPDAPAKALAEDPIWTARPPAAPAPSASASAPAPGR